MHSNSKIKPFTPMKKSNSSSRKDKNSKKKSTISPKTSNLFIPKNSQPYTLSKLMNIFFGEWKRIRSPIKSGKIISKIKLTTWKNNLTSFKINSFLWRSTKNSVWKEWKKLTKKFKKVTWNELKKSRKWRWFWNKNVFLKAKNKKDINRPSPFRKWLLEICKTLT